MTSTAPNRVVVATQHALLGEALAMLIDQDERFSAHCLESAISIDTVAERLPVDILLLDASFEVEIATDICRRLRHASPDAAVVLLDGDDAQRSNRRAATLGAAGVLSIRTPSDLLADALLQTSGGARLHTCRTIRRDKDPLDQLTERERQVLDDLADGRTPDQIAVKLDISPHTVRTHIENAMARLGAASRLEAVALVRKRHGHIQTDAGPVASRKFPASNGPDRDPAESANVVVAAEATIFRDALRVALERMENVEVVGEVTSVAELEHLLQTGGWNVAVIDDTVRGGINAACALVKSWDGAPRVLVTSRSPDETVLLGAVEAGADGYLTRGAGLVQFEEAIDKVRNGEASIPPRMLGALLRNLIDRRREEDSAVARLAMLTKRERTVLGLLIEGLDQEQIATRLVVSPHTARTHVQNVLRKLEVHSRLEAVALVTSYNLHERFELKAKAG